jgi:RNA-splicing ligase RtcB
MWAAWRAGKRVAELVEMKAAYLAALMAALSVAWKAEHLAAQWVESLVERKVGDLAVMMAENLVVWMAEK